MGKIPKIVYLEEQYYITAGESVETCIIEGRHVVYIHYKNGYYSYFVGLENLLKYLNEGDPSGRLLCVENTEVFENLLSLDNRLLNRIKGLV